MIKSIKKLIYWTPSDIKAWENIRQKGFWRFVLLFGACGFGSFLFVVTSVITFIAWLQAPGGTAILILQLVFTGGVCLLGGFVAGLLTWWLEDGIYWKITKSRAPM